MKYFFIGIFSVIVFVVSIVVFTVGILAWVVFTPERLTPIIQTQASALMDANLTFSKVEITAWSSFPNVEIELLNGALTSKEMLAGAKSDTIVSFESLKLVANPYQYLTDNKLSIKEVSLVKPGIYAYVDSTGRANWDVFKFESDTTAADTAALVLPDIALQRLAVSGGHMVLDDRENGIYERLGNLSLGVKCDMDSARLTLDELRLGIERTTFVGSGWLAKDSLDVALELVVPSIKEVMAFIPTRFLDTERHYRFGGELDFRGTVRGAFTGGHKPVVTGKVSVNKGSFHYLNMPNAVNDMTMAADFNLDMDKKSESFINITKLNVVGTAMNLDLSGRMVDPLGVPSFDFRTAIAIDFDKLASTLPLRKSVKFKGQFAFQGQGQSNMGQINRGDWAHIKANGKVQLNDFSVIDTLKHFYFTSSSASLDINNTQQGMLTVSGSLGNVFSGARGLYKAELEHVEMTAEGIKSSDSTSFFKGDFRYASFYGTALNDTMELRSPSSHMTVELSSNVAKMHFKSDSLYARLLDDELKLKVAGISLKVTKKDKAQKYSPSNVDLSGTVAFGGVEVVTPRLPLPISAKMMAVQVGKNFLRFKGAEFKVGDSDLKLSARVENLGRHFKNPEIPVVVRGELASRNLDMNQLINTINNVALRDGLSTAIEPSADTSQLPIIPVPRDIDATLKLKVGSLLFGDVRVSDLSANMRLLGGVSTLDSMTLRAHGAKLKARVVYHMDDDSTACSHFALLADSIDIHSMVALVPSIDSLAPMVRSIEGMVEFNITAQAEFVKYFTLDLPRMKAAADLKAQNIILLDNETFRSVAKMLMFKHKDRNEIDSLQVMMISENGMVEILPFTLQLDRYKVALGGTQQLDGAMNYHVSVLRSPIPFKFGVNVTGTFHDIKIDLGKTQYKYLAKPGGDSSLIETYKVFVKKLEE